MEERRYRYEEELLQSPVMSCCNGGRIYCLHSIDIWVLVLVLLSEGMPEGSDQGRLAKQAETERSLKLLFVCDFEGLSEYIIFKCCYMQYIFVFFQNLFRYCKSHASARPF